MVGQRRNSRYLATLTPGIPGNPGFSRRLKLLITGSPVQLRSGTVLKWRPKRESVQTTFAIHRSVLPASHTQSEIPPSTRLAVAAELLAHSAFQIRAVPSRLPVASLWGGRTMPGL